MLVIHGGLLLKNCICRKCKTVVEVPIKDRDLQRWRAGGLIQHVAPYLSVDHREILISGYCGKCFDQIAKPPDEPDEVVN